MSNKNLVKCFLQLWRHSKYVLNPFITYEEVAIAGFKQTIVHLEHKRYAQALNDAEGSIEFLRKLTQEAKEVIG